MSGRFLKVAGVVVALAASTAVAAPAATAASKAEVQEVRLYELTTGQGFFYTASASEEASAVSKHGFKPTQTPLPSVSRTSFPGAVTLYRLRMNGRASYIVSLGAEARQLAASGKFTLEGVLGYLDTTKSANGGEVGLWRLTYDNNWRLAITSHMHKIVNDEQPRWRIDGQLGDGWGPAVNSNS
jgi:hypothetical protein